MKKILISVSIIAAAAAVVVGATTAYFSDTETSTGNTFTAGTIDITMANQVVTLPTQIGDIKPGMTQYIDFDVNNVGVNPVVLRKELTHFQPSGNIISEPECEEEGGTWITDCTGNVAEDDLSPYVVYDMVITDGTDKVIVNESWNIKLSQLKDLWVPLGTMDAGDTWHVRQSYHLDEQTGNKLQGDMLTFDFVMSAEQRLGPGPTTITGVVLENKSGDPDWYTLIGDGIWGVFNYDASTHNYTAKAFGLEAGTTYRLTHRTTGNPVDLVTGVAAGDGTLVLSGNYDFGSTSDVKINLTYGATLWGDNLKNLWEGNPINF